MFIFQSEFNIDIAFVSKHNANKHIYIYIYIYIYTCAGECVLWSTCVCLGAQKFRAEVNMPAGS